MAKSLYGLIAQPLASWLTGALAPDLYKISMMWDYALLKCFLHRVEQEVELEVKTDYHCH